MNGVIRPARRGLPGGDQARMVAIVNLDVGSSLLVGDSTQALALANQVGGGGGPPAPPAATSRPPSSGRARPARLPARRAEPHEASELPNPRRASRRDRARDRRARHREDLAARVFVTDRRLASTAK